MPIIPQQKLPPPPPPPPTVSLSMFAAMQRKLRQVFCALKEHSSIKYAKVATFSGFCDLDLIIVKATSPDDFPLPERYINELLKIFSISTSSFHSFSISFTRRFGRTHSWKVALKCLLLLHRLLRSLPDNTPFRTELLWAKSNGLLSLYPCRFRDDSSSNPEDYTLFIRSYAHLLDEALACFAMDAKYEEDETASCLQDKMKEIGRNLEILPQLQSLIDRVMECRPAGAAARSLIIQLAMKHMIRDSFICYTTFRKEIVLVLDNLIQMPYRSCVLSFGIYKKAATQADELSEFYDWCKVKGLCGSYEFPLIERIPEIQIRALETFLNGIWQLTDKSSSSSCNSPSSWLDQSNQSSPNEENNDNVNYTYNYKQMVRFEENEEMMPLIQLEDGENDNWEVLLDASLNISRFSPSNFLTVSNGFEFEEEEEEEEVWEKNKNEGQIKVYNPFCQPNPAYPWSL